MSVLIDMNSKIYVVLFGSYSLIVSELLDMNSEKMYVILVCSNSLEVSELLDMNPEKVLFGIN